MTASRRATPRLPKRRTTAGTPSLTPPVSALKAKSRTTTGPRILTSEADVREGVKALRRTCPIIRRMHDVTGDPPLRRREPGFEGLARIIVGQQVSVASAAAIWARTAKAVQPFEPRVVLGLTENELRGAGLSRPKIKTLIAIANELSGTTLDLDRLEGLTDEEVHRALTRISGIGPWTADVFLMFCLGRADAFAGGDLALQIAAQRAMQLDARPSTLELVAIAERWRPWRGVAALLLWAYYKVDKSAASGMPV